MIRRIKQLYRVWQAKKRLAAYVRTLSPAKQAAADALREKLKNADAKQSAAILMQEANAIRLKQFRVIEKIDVQLTKVRQ